MFLCEVFPLLPAGDTISTPVGLVALWLISSYIFGCRKTNEGRKKENVKMQEKNKVQCFYEGHQCTRRLPFHMITRKLLHIFHGSCLFHAAIDQACCDLAPLFPLTNWVPVCFQMSECNRIAMRLSLRQRSNPVATRSPSQQQKLGVMLSRVRSQWIDFTLYSPLPRNETTRLSTLLLRSEAWFAF